MRFSKFLGLPLVWYILTSTPNFKWLPPFHHHGFTSNITSSERGFFSNYPSKTISVILNNITLSYHPYCTCMNFLVHVLVYWFIVSTSLWDGSYMRANNGCSVPRRILHWRMNETSEWCLGQLCHTMLQMIFVLLIPLPNVYTFGIQFSLSFNDSFVNS